MDIYGTACTAAAQVIQVSIFIKGVLDEIKAYDDERANIQLQIDLQVMWLETFSLRFLNKEGGLMLPGNLPKGVPDNICRLLLKMSRVLGEYQSLVRKYELHDAAKEPEKNDSSSQKEMEKWRDSFLRRVKTKAKTIKLKGFDWAIFDKAQLLTALEEYKQWTNELKSIMQFCSIDALSQHTDANATENKDPPKEVTGLEAVIKRQKLAKKEAPADFQELEGNVEEDGKGANQFQIGRWIHNGESTEVMIEYRKYDPELLYDDDLEPDEILALKAPTKNLAWLLQNATFSDGDSNPFESDQPTIFSLQCLGYIDQEEKQRTAFLYKFPLCKPESGLEPAADIPMSITTLHDFINGLNGNKRPLKPELGHRFGIAHCLALTLFNVHGSLWVHKNIWSRGIILFSQGEDGTIGPIPASESPDNTTGNKSQRILAFLEDWGSARPEKAATAMRADFEVEPNLYRHPTRQGKPTLRFERQHDIYALGVVLLEIGLWKTLSQVFELRIKQSQQTGKLPKPKEVRRDLIKLAQKILPTEMGIKYASAVEACLNGDFKDGSDIELSLDFGAKVIQVLAEGQKL
ncbi:hypothetical protein FQN57_006416 [Myotisia sp. PD_48]|nr:hypothetical protein FQN57_006416 [Myotisia sp. PD_48]